MNSARNPIPTRDYSILSPRQFRVIKDRTKPIGTDRSAEIERQKNYQKHQTTQSLTSLWPNTIARNRIDKQTRLQREKEAEEERKKLIDAEEKKIQKLKRQASLAEASKYEFQQRPEVRAVNAQLLLHEVQEEREMQKAFRERRQLEEMKQQIREDEERALAYERAVENENKIRRERREKAIKNARELRQQRDQVRQLKQEQKAQDFEEELILAEHMKKELEVELETTRLAKLAARRHNEEQMRENSQMIQFKKKMEEIDREEDRRLIQLQIEKMDREDEQKAVEEKKKREKLIAQEAIYEAERQRQLKIKEQEKDFLDKQIAEQQEKAAREVEQVRMRQQKLIEERRRDFQESLQLKEQKQQRLKEKRINNGDMQFPVDPRTARAEEEAWEREQQRMQANRELALFQMRQMKEKREREKAEKERARLEIQKEIEREQQEMEMAQEYARNMLAQAQSEDYD